MKILYTHKIVAEKSKINKIAVALVEDVDKTVKELEDVRLIRDRMIDRLKKAFGIESQELEVIEEEIMKHVVGEHHG